MTKVLNLHITHYDMDGAGCVIVRKNCDSDTYITRGVNYTSIDDEIMKVGLVDGDVDLLITDLNFKPSQLRRLLEMDNVTSVQYFDHHEVHSNEEMQEFYEIRKFFPDKLLMEVDPGICGTKLIYRSKYRCQTLPGRPRMDAVIQAIDTYDCWRTERPEFLGVSCGLNDLFWNLGFDGFIDALKDAAISDAHRDIIRSISTERTEFLTAAIQNSTVVEELNLLIVHSPSCKFVNDFVLRYPDYDFYLILKNVFDTQLGWSFRVKSENPFTTSHVIEGLKADYGRPISMGGHKKACGITIDKEDLEFFLDKFTQLIFETRAA